MHAWRSLLILTLLASSVAAQCPPEQLFLAAQRTNVTVSNMAAADFNADGRTDFAACSGSISTLDFNHDGIVDLSSKGVVDVYLANGVDAYGNLTFLPPAHYSGGVLLGQGVGVGDGSFALSSAPSTTDFNGDGIYDLVGGFGPFCNSYPNDCPIGISVQLGQGAGGIWDGTFAPPVRYGMHSNPNVPESLAHLYVVDATNDGLLDVFLLTNTRTLLFRGNGANGIGDGTFSPEFFGGAMSYAWFGDLNSDSLLDIAEITTGACGSQLGLLLGQVGGSWTAGSTFPLSNCATPQFATGIAFGNVDRDGIPDLVVATSNSVALLRGDGPGRFREPVFLPIPVTTTAAIAIGDFRRDSIPDVLVGGSSAVFLLGRCPLATEGTPPSIQVGDVPNDQGGHVTVAWSGSPVDAPGYEAITEYSVWRRTAPPTKPEVAADTPLRAIELNVPFARIVGPPGGRRENNAPTYWEPLARMPAHFLLGYGFTANTTQDSTASDNAFTAFFVSALTADPYVFFDSEIDSAYSVDNLAPGIPKGVRGLGVRPGLLRLIWRRNQEPDLSHYAVYKGFDPTFTPGPENLLAVTRDSTFLDEQFGVSTYYRVTALDIHGNESPNPPLVTSVEMPGFATSLQVPFVTPDGSVLLQYSLGERGGQTRIALFDVAGRRIYAVNLGHQEPGHYLLPWDARSPNGTAVGRGVYFAELTCGDRRATRKFTITHR